jgi:uncharacterized protein (DUF2342 family)
MKMRQYEQGKHFCDTVASSHGITMLNRVWSSPEALPSAAELRKPETWVARVGELPAAA